MTNDTNDTNLIHPKSLYRGDIINKSNIETEITLRTPDNIVNLIRYLNYSEL